MTRMLTKAKASRALKWASHDWSETKDPRDPRGKRHSHEGMLDVIVAGLATLALTLREVESFAEDLPARTRRKLGLRGMVSDTALYSLLTRQDEKGLAHAVERQVKDGLAAKTITNDLLPFGVAAIDGKKVLTSKHEAHSLCQRHEPESGSPYWLLFSQMVSLVSSSVRPCIYQQFIAGKTNEMASFERCVRHVDEHFGRSIEVYTSDAGATSRHNASVIHDDLQKAYVFALKGNQPTVHAAARSRLSTRETPGDDELEADAFTQERSCGWDVRRELFRCAVAADDAEVDFAGAKHLLRVRQTAVRRDDSGRELERTIEDRYFVTNRVFKAEHALAIVRTHWGIENGPNWTLDVVFKEDEGSPCARGQGALVITWLRVLAYNLAAIWRRKQPPKHGEPLTWKRCCQLLRDALRGIVGNTEERSPTSV